MRIKEFKEILKENINLNRENNMKNTISMEEIEEVDREYLLIPNIDENGFLNQCRPHIVLFSLSQEDKTFALIGECSKDCTYLRLLSEDIEKEIKEFNYEEYESNLMEFQMYLQMKTH